MIYICECLGQGSWEGTILEGGIFMVDWAFWRCLVFTSFCPSYAGHGAGARFLDGQAVLRLSCRAVALLFGCSSAALAVHGNLEGAGIVLKYIMAGW